MSFAVAKPQHKAPYWGEEIERFVKKGEYYENFKIIVVNEFDFGARFC